MARYMVYECDCCKKRGDPELLAKNTVRGKEFELCKECEDTLLMLLCNNMPTKLNLGIEAIMQLEKIAGGQEQLNEATQLATGAVVEALETLAEFAAK